MFLIVDGNNLAHRVRYTFNLSNRGVDVSVTYGFLRVLDSMMTQFEPTSVMVAWDGGVPEHRRKRIPSYKANRTRGSTPEERATYEDFVRQMQELDQILPYMGVLSIRKKGAEADDLMYHAAKISIDGVVIVSTDKDMFQAVDRRVSVYSPTKEKLYTPEQVEEEFGVPVSQYIEWRALQGDGSDNIEGIHGIGEKTATKLLQEWGTLTGVWNGAIGRAPGGEIGGKTGQRIKEFGFDKIVDNIYVMALYKDRTGAKLTIVDEISNYPSRQVKAVKRYLLANNFLSLMDGRFFTNLSRLGPPEIRDDIRTPVVCNFRVPVDE